jgi:hypothetical protein
MAGAKAKIVERFTELSHSRISAMYRALRGIDPPAGPVVQGSAHSFAVPGKKTSELSRAECGIFLACFERMGKITPTPVQRGWRLLAAYNAYLRFTEKLNETAPNQRLDINQAYALLTYCGFMTLQSGAELQRRQCPKCSFYYAIVANERLEGQGCPVCAIDANSRRLARARLASRHQKPPAKAL